MTQEDVVRLVMQVVGEADVKRLTEAIDKEKEALERVARQFGVNDPAAIKHAESIGHLTAKLHDAERAAGLAGSKMAGMGQSLLQVGRGIQDFQAAGIAGVTNNIEGLAMALGGGPGLAGVLTVVGVGIHLALPLIKELIASFQTEAPKLFGSQIEKLNDQLKVIQDKKTKVEFDFTEMERLKKEIEAATKGKQALDRIMGKKTEEVVESEKQVEAIVSTPEGQAALGKIKAGMIDRGIAGDKDVQAATARRDALDAQVKGAEEFLKTAPGEAAGFAAERLRDLTEQRAAAEEGLVNARKVARTAAENDAGALGTDARRQAELAEKLRAIGEGVLAAKVAEASPANVKKKKEMVEQIERDNEIEAESNRKAADAAKELGEAKKKEAAARKQQVDQRAGAIAGAMGGTMAFREWFDPEAVRRSLMESGDTEEQAEGLKGEVFNRAKEIAEEKVRQHALALGTDRQSAVEDLRAKFEAGVAKPGDKAKTEREKDVEKQADIFRKGFAGGLGGMMDRGATDKALEKAVGDKLKIGDKVPADMQAEVAANIVAGARTDFNARRQALINQGMMPARPRPRPKRSAAQGTKFGAPRTKYRGKTRTDFGPKAQKVTPGPEVGAAAVADPVQRVQSELVQAVGALAAKVAQVERRANGESQKLNDVMRGIAGIGRPIIGRV